MRTAGYDSSDAVLLTHEVQAEYARRYGSPDESPDGHKDFVPPGRTDAEIRRMYVRPVLQRKGMARQVPGATALYRSSGYTHIAPLGYYSDPAASVHLGKEL